MLVRRTGIDALGITEEEAKELATTFVELTAFYGKKKTGVTAKAFAWFAFLIAIGGTYLPMMVTLYRMYKDRQVAEQAA